MLLSRLEETSEVNVSKPALYFDQQDGRVAGGNCIYDGQPNRSGGLFCHCAFAMMRIRRHTDPFHPDPGPVPVDLQHIMHNAVRVSPGLRLGFAFQGEAVQAAALCRQCTPPVHPMDGCTYRLHPFRHRR